MAISPDEHEIFIDPRNVHTPITLKFAVGHETATLQFSIDEAQQLGEDLIQAAQEAR